MALLLEDQGRPPVSLVNRDDALLHRMGCRVCPLSNIGANKHPQMPATGAKKPLVYMLGEAPGQHEDTQGKQFVGDSGQLLRDKIPEHFRKRVRYNNVVRTRPVRNKTPEHTEIECCRPSVIADIEASRPKAIFGFGNIPLNWISGMTGVTLWRGRKMPVRVGTHTCWYYPMLHPAYLVRQRPKVGVSEQERMFGLDLDRAFAEVEGLPEPIVHTATNARAGVEIIAGGGSEALDRITEALAWAIAQPAVGVDYETNCLRPYAKGARVLSAAVGTGKRAIAFPFDHPQSGWTPKERQRLQELWRSFLRAPVCRLSHNLAFELEWTGVMFGQELVRELWEDSAVQASIIDERKGRQKPGCFALEWLVQQYFGFNLKNISALDRKKLSEAPLEAVLFYNGMDAKYHALLWEQQDAVIAEQGLGEAYELALRRVPAVVLTQMKGVPVDQKEVKRLQKKYGERIEGLLADIEALPIIKQFRKQYHKDFKPLSNPDVLKVFKDMLQCPECEIRDKKTKKIRYSTDEAVLVQIDHPLVQLLLDLRHANKRKSTYIDPLREGSDVLYPDGLLHAQFNTFFAETGRLSCDGPNLQNFPNREDEAREVRRQIKADRGNVILKFDYGQIEARVIAMFTKDPRFCKALWDRYDIHQDWAERIASAYPRRIGGKQNLKDKKVMKDFRTDIKNQWTFPLVFGATLQSASGYLKIPEDELTPLFDEFWEEFEGIHKWQKNQLKFYQEYGYVECLTGRRRRGPMSVNQVYNSPVQGTAAEIVMDGMSRLSELGDPELQPEINIHDDLTFLRVPADRVDEIAEKVLDQMLAVPFDWVNVPITAEASLGTDWERMEEIGDFSSDEWFGKE